MSLLRHLGLRETKKQERARLAQAPEGSTSRYLSCLPITLTKWPQSLLVRLPWDHSSSDEKYTVVVVPIAYHEDPRPTGLDEKFILRKRNPGTWTCVVVFSNHPSYRVGGHDIFVGADELARGEEVCIEGIPALSQAEGDAS